MSRKVIRWEVTTSAHGVETHMEFKVIRNFIRTLKLGRGVTMGPDYFRD